MGKSFEPWQEELLDTGYEDMHLVMQALREVEFDGLHTSMPAGGVQGVQEQLTTMMFFEGCK